MPSSGRHEPQIPRAAIAARRQRVLLCLAVSLAIALPLLHTAFLRATPTFDVPIIDSADYVDAAREEMGGASERGVYFHSPLYSWFLAAVFETFGFRYGAVRVLQCLLNGATCALVYALGRRIFGARVGLVAAFAWGLYAPVVFFAGEVLNVSWLLFLDTAALYAILRAASAGRPSAWLFAGGVTGLAAITRPDILPFALVAIAMGCRSHPRPGRVWIAVAFTAGVAAPLLLVGARNALLAGRFAVLPANSGLNFYIGNNPEYARTIGIRPGLPYESLKALPDREHAGGAPSDVDRSAYFYARALRYVTGDVRGYLGCVWYKVRVLVSGVELPETFDLYTVRAFSPVLAALAWRAGGFGFPFGLWLPLAVWGAWAQPRTGQTRWLWAWLGSLTLPLLGYWSSSRYRMPLVPVVTLWAAAAAVDAFDLRRRREYRRLAVAAVVVFTAGTLFNQPYDHFSRTHRYDAEMYGFAGLRLAREGRVDLALPLLHHAVALDAGRLEFQSGLGYALVESGRSDEAIAHLEAAVAIDPLLAPAWNNLGLAHARRGEIGAAIDSFKRSLRLDPDQSYAQENLRRLLDQQRQEPAQAAATLTVSPST